MENDIANSTAGGIARQLKATDRCIGKLSCILFHVMTDML
jgi:hypothetical protein